MFGFVPARIVWHGRGQRRQGHGERKNCLSEASYKISSKDWHSSPERVVEKKVSANVFKEMEALGREYKIFKWKVFRKSELFALDAATVSLSVSYKDPTNGAGWTLTMRSDDELNDKQREYYHKLLDLLYGAEGR